MKRTITRLAAYLLLVLSVACCGGAQASAASIEAVASVGTVVSDIDRSVAFYSHVFGFQQISDAEVSGENYEHLEGLFGVRMRVVRMQLGDEILELTEFLTPKGRLVPQDSRSNDLWFQHIAIITSDMDRAYQLLRQNHVRYASTGPQTLPSYISGAAGIRAFYLRDPDDQFLEVLQFPADKGAAKWHKSSRELFLGIDHTAIVVRDTETSLKFYRDKLGMRVAGESENYGTEQEHLNNVFGARLRITSLRAPAGPGIELLEYLTPRDGRIIPADSRADDLWVWQTTLVPAPKLAQIAPVASPFNSPISFANPTLGFRMAALTADPDGHIMRVVER